MRRSAASLQARRCAASVAWWPIRASPAGGAAETFAKPVRRRGFAATLALATVALTAAAANAQVPPAELGQRFVPAPWWLRDPVVIAIGSVRTEVPANRAHFTARFSAVERTAAEASTAAAKRARDLDAALRGLGAERVRLTTTFATRPLYDQYRTKEGTLVDNVRGDKIDRYEVTANVAIEVRDMAALERAYRTVVAAKPSGIDAVYFALEPDNGLKTWLATESIRDAARRARLSVEASGGRVGAPKIVDPTGGVCQTPIFAGWPSYVGGTSPTTVAAPASFRNFAPAPPPPPPPAPAVPSGSALDAAADAVQVTLQPPLRTLEQTACVVYALLP